MTPEHKNWYLEPGYCNELLAECKNVLAKSYDIKLLADDARPLIIGENIDHLDVDDIFLERTTDRTYYATTQNNQYTLNFDDYELFEQELEDVMGYEHDFDVQRLAHVLFIGQGVGRTAIRYLFDQKRPTELKQEAYEQMLQEFLASHDSIEEKIEEIFFDEAFKDRAKMVNILSDKRAEEINKLRMSMRVLFDTPFVYDNTGMDYYELISRAEKHILESYTHPDNQMSTDLMTQLGRDPLKIDERFFDSLSSWVIAAATPMSPGSYRHLNSDGWQRD